jgi:hypothetical protein
MLAVDERGKRIDACLGDDHDAPAAAAVAAVRPAAGDVFLSAKADAPVAPFAGFDFDGDAVYKHGRCRGSRVESRVSGGRGPDEGLGFSHRLVA